MEEFLNRVRGNRNWAVANEEAVCQGIVLPLLALLGWDRDNTEEVAPQWPCGDIRVDYCLRRRGASCAFIEVKRPSEDLASHEKQLLQYAFAQTEVRLALLTNGLVWWFYLPHLTDRNWNERKFIAIDINEQDAAATKKHFEQFLGREPVESGEAVEAARKLLKDREVIQKIKTSIPDAWRQMCQQPDKALLELLARRVESLCGHKPDYALLAEFLAKQTKERIDEVDDKYEEGEEEDERGQGPGQNWYNQDWTHKRPVAFESGGTRHHVATSKEVLVGVAGELAAAHPSDFEARVRNLRGHTKPWFSRNPGELLAPKLFGQGRVYIETNISANAIRDRCRRLLEHFRHEKSALRVELR